MQTFSLRLLSRKCTLPFYHWNYIVCPLSWTENFPVHNSQNQSKDKFSPLEVVQCGDDCVICCVDGGGKSLSVSPSTSLGRLLKQANVIKKTGYGRFASFLVITECDNELWRHHINPSHRWKTSGMEQATDEVILWNESWEWLHKLLQNRVTSKASQAVGSTWGTEWWAKERKNYHPKRWPHWRSIFSSHWISTKFYLTDWREAIRGR